MIRRSAKHHNFCRQFVMRVNHPGGGHCVIRIPMAPSVSDTCQCTCQSMLRSGRLGGTSCAVSRYATVGSFGSQWINVRLAQDGNAKCHVFAQSLLRAHADRVRVFVRVRPTLFDGETPGAVKVDEEAYQKITVKRTCAPARCHVAVCEAAMNLASSAQVHLRPECKLQAQSKPGIPCRDGGAADSNFIFDRILTPAATQQHVYDAAVAPIVDDVMLGYNGSVMAYGQTVRPRTYPAHSMQRHWDVPAFPLLGDLRGACQTHAQWPVAAHLTVITSAYDAGRREDSHAG